MKYFIATDIHGSYFFAKKVVEEFERSGADKLVLLGDLYYHGPRNPLPEEHAPMKVAELFNSLSDKIIAIKGNCDAEIDEMISTFPFSPAVHVNVGGERVTFTHGHYFNKDVLPIGCDLLVYGHFHVNELTERDGTTCVCVASASLPKNGCKPSYMLLDEDGFVVRTLDGDVIFEKSFS